MLQRLSDAIAAFETLAPALGRSPKTVQWVSSSAELFSRFLGDPPLGQISRHDFRRFIAALQERHRFAGHPTSTAGGRLSSSSVNCYARGVKLLFSTLHREELVSEDPLATARAPRVPAKLVEPFFEQEVRAVFQALKLTSLPHRNVALAAFLLDTGARRGELVGLDKTDVDLSSGMAKVSGKTGPRLVPFGSQTARALLHYLAKERRDGGGEGSF